VVGNKRFVRLVTVRAGAVALCALSPMATASADDPNLVGSWTGHRERIASTEGYRNGTATLDNCYAEHGQGYRATCARLQKEA
jgi:hypothetical protein